MALLEFTSRGLYCPAADVYIDPWRRVDRAIITHAHADHARPGHGHYLCTPATLPILRHRLGRISAEALPYGDITNIKGVDLSFYPAGHVLGSAQVRVARKGEVWVVSGDYKLEDDGISGVFEPVRCHTFITESTFGLPVYRWRPQQEVMQEMNTWWRRNREEGRVSVIGAYSLGKAQRIIGNVDAGIGRIYCHGAVEKINALYRAEGVALPPTEAVGTGRPREDLAGALVVAPPSAIGSEWMKQFGPVELASASGWMQLRGRRRWQSVDKGFVLSDHADWTGLNAAVEATGAERVFVTHGYTAAFGRWLSERGLEVLTAESQYDEEDD